MPPTLSWLDSSSASRRKAMEVIKLFEEKGTVDEIGIGSVRDALSDSLFPGTSVLHTRARYFFIIPWLYQALEAKGTPSAAIAREARRSEVGLIETLLAAEDNAGTIGRVAKLQLKILPSTMYWTGLHAWGLRPPENSQDQYHRSLDRFYRSRASSERDDDGQALDGRRKPNWHAGIPAAPAGFPKCPLSFELTRAEADYLRERILTQCPGTLLAHLVDRCKPADDAPFVWEHTESPGFPGPVKERLVHARNFSETIHGAALLYNLMLSELGKREEGIEAYRTAFSEWARRILDRRADLGGWNRGEFWKLVTAINPRIPAPTRSFVDGWLDLALAGTPGALRDYPRARGLISNRERAMKGRLARLHSPEALARWRGASGASQLNFRWDPQVRRLTSDIQRGLLRNA